MGFLISSRFESRGRRVDAYILGVNVIMLTNSVSSFCIREYRNTDIV